MQIELEIEDLPPIPRYADSDDICAARVRSRTAFESYDFWVASGVEPRKIPKKYNVIIPPPPPKPPKPPKEPKPPPPPKPPKPPPPPKPPKPPKEPKPPPPPKPPKEPKPPPPPKPPKEPKPVPPPPPPPEITVDDKEEALSIFLEQPTAPLAPTTSGAAKALERLLKRFDYNLTNSTNKMRQYVMFKLFELAENDDPRLSIKAIEMLGKVSEIGLFSTKIEVSSADKPTAELESELSTLLATYSLGELGAIDGTSKELTDAELRGDAE